MPCYIRMKTLLFRDLLWFYTLALSYMVSSLEPGTPGFLDFDNLPDTNFSCVGKVIGGYYADLETNCQMFHVCTIGQLDEPMDIRFLCLNGTVFDQETRVCERIDEVDCSKSEDFYSLNLELYGNTQPSNIEESLETEPPIVIKSTTTTTTTTTTERPKPKTTRTPSYYTTPLPTITTGTNSKVISTHHFPVSNSPDIRFNPEEINISLNPGAPPNIRSKPVSFQQQIFANGDNRNNNNKAIITTHTSYEGNKQQAVNTQRIQITSSTQRPKSVINYGLTHDDGPATPSDINYGFAYGKQYHKETPLQHSYQYHANVANFKPDIPGQYRNQFRTSTYRNEHLAVTRKVPYTNSHTGVTTYKNPYITSLKPTNYHSGYKHDKPQRLQLSLPLLPTLTPLTFSSPAPFTLSRHSEAKRYTNEHQAPPRIIISASASVSDASGRRLNYSLGTIGVTPLLEQPPKSYDDYKDHDVVLDPFYHDVPKVKKNREKRQTKVNHAEVIRSEQEAVDVLKFLFDWYKNHEKSTTMVSIPVTPEDITKINDDLRPTTMERPLETSREIPSAAEVDINLKENDLFRKGKFNIVGDVLVVTENEQRFIETSTEEYRPVQDYVDDNYEPLTYQDGSKEKLGFEKEYSEIQDEHTSERTEDKEKILTYQDNQNTYEENSRVPVKNTFEEQLRQNLEKSYEGGSKDKSNYDRTYYNETQITENDKSQGQDSLLKLKIDLPETDHLANHSEIRTNSTTEKQPRLSSRSRGRNRGRSRFMHPGLNYESYNNAKKISSQLTDATYIHNTTSPSTTTTTTVTISPEYTYQPEDLTKYTEDTSKSYTNSLNAVSLVETTTANESEETTTISSEETTTVYADSTIYNGESGVTTVEPTYFIKSELESVHSLERETIPGFFIKKEKESAQPLELTPSQAIKPEPDYSEPQEPVLEAKSRSTSRLMKPTEPAINFNSLYVNENFASKEPNYDQESGTTTLADDINTTTLENALDETFKVPEEYATSTEEATETTTVQNQEYTTEAVTTTQKSTTTESLSTLLSGIKQYLVDGSTLDAINIFDKEIELDEDIKSTYAPTTEKDTKSSLGSTTSPTLSSSLSTHEPTLQTSTETITNITPAVDSTTEKLTTTVAPLATTNQVSRRSRPTRPHRNRPYNRNNSKHRFSTQSFTSRPTSRRKLEETEPTTQTVENLTNEMVTVNNRITEETPTSTQVGYVEDVPATDAPLYKSANPTQAEIPKDSTTPLSGVRSHNNREKPVRGFVFNCFGKELNKFYLDPRDCRLFHYCTTGYTRNQLLDMKFVCDLGTYFDHDKLICTKGKPERCS